MADDSPVEMDEDERDTFLGTGGTGVLSFGTAGDRPPHAVPVSYGYDAEEATFYFRLATGSDSEKGDPNGRPVTFVTHRQVDDRHHSVVASGRLESADESSIATQTLEGLDRVHIPLVDIFEEPVRTVGFEFFRLVPDDLTGRKESRTDA